MHELLRVVDPLVATSGLPVATASTNLLILALLCSAVWISVVHAVHRAIWLLVVQSVALAGVALVTALVSGVTEIYLSVLVTLVVKAVLVPLVLGRVLRRSVADDAGRMYLGRRTVFIVALALALFSFG